MHEALVIKIVLSMAAFVALLSLVNCGLWLGRF